MAFCSNCGGAVADGVRFCPACGREAGGSGAEGTAYAPTQKMQPVTPSSAGLEQNVAGLLCYVLGLITGIVFLVLEPYNRNPFIRFHAFQSIFFFVACFVITLVMAAVPFVGWMLAPLLYLAQVVIWILLMVKAYQGEKWKLPVIGDLAEKQQQSG